MTHMDIAGTPIDVDPSLREHVRAYGRMAQLAMAVSGGEAQLTDAGTYAFDGLVGVGEALSPDHLADGVVAREPDGTRYNYRLFDDRGHALTVRGVLQDTVVARDALGLALTPGVNGIKARLSIQAPDGTETMAVSTGSLHDWYRVA